MKRVLIAFMLILVFSSVSCAHKISTFAYVTDEGIVHTETYFSDGTKAKKALVEVYDKEGKLLLKGRTDENGVFEFSPPKLGKLKIAVTAELGHRATTIVEVKRTSGRSDEKMTTVQKVKSVISQKELESMIDRKLKPMYEKLIKIEEELSKPRLSEIFGGIGYILGIFGIIAYMISKRR